jgi:OmpA family
VVASIQSELKQLSDLIRRHPACPPAVFGHADPVGSGEYNKALSGRRATAVYAVLIAGSALESAAGLWETIAGQENWGTPALNAMQQATGLPSGSSRSSSIRAYLQLLGQKCHPRPSRFSGQRSRLWRNGRLSGCGEFNPLLIFSGNEQSEFAQDSDDTRLNRANAPNRRVNGRDVPARCRWIQVNGLVLARLKARADALSVSGPTATRAAA